jgi:transposase
MARNYRTFDEDLRQGAVALVVETGKPIAHVAWDLDINEGTLGNRCTKERRARQKDRSLDPDERAELERGQRAGHLLASHRESRDRRTPSPRGSAVIRVDP